MAVNLSAGVAPNPSVGKPRAISASAHAGRCEGCGATIALTEKILLVSPSLAAHIGKYDGLFGRLCVIWHCIENIDQPYLPDVITVDTARRVAKFLHEYLLPHAIVFYTDILGLSDEHDRLTAVAGYILAHKLERVTNRDIAHGDRTMRGLTKRETENVFEQLDALGWVNRVPAPRPSDPPHWLVNPEVHTRFKARGEAEAKRRSAARAAILESIGALRANGANDEES
jgi:hypothetical protein